MAWYRSRVVTLHKFIFSISNSNGTTHDIFFLFIIYVLGSKRESSPIRLEEAVIGVFKFSGTNLSILIIFPNWEDERRLTQTETWSFPHLSLAPSLLHPNLGSNHFKHQSTRSSTRLKNMVTTTYLWWVNEFVYELKNMGAGEQPNIPAVHGLVVVVKPSTTLQLLSYTSPVIGC